MEQFITVTERPQTHVYGRNFDTQEQYFFSNFDTKEKLMAYVSNLNEGLKIYSMFKIDIEGNKTYLTIGFNEGRLGLIEK